MRKNILKKVVTLGLVSIMALSQVTAAFAASIPKVYTPDIATVRSNTSYTYYVRSGMSASEKTKMRLYTYHSYSVRGGATQQSPAKTYSATTKYMPAQTNISGITGDHVKYLTAFSSGYYYEGATYKQLPTQWSRFN